MILKIAYRHIRYGKAKTVIAVLGMFLASYIISVIISINSSLLSTIKYDVAYRYGDYSVALINADINEQKRFLRTVSGEKIYKNIEGYSNCCDKGVYIYSVSPNWFNHFKCQLVKGAFPNNDYEMVIPESIYEKDISKYAVGNSISLMMGERIDAEGEPIEENCGITENEKIENHHFEEFKIVGIYKDDDRATIKPMSDFEYFYYVDNKMDSKNNSCIYSDELKYRELEKYENDFDTSCLIYNNEYLDAIGISKTGESTFKSIVLFCALLVVVVSITVALFVGNAFLISYRERTNELGVLSSIGAKNTYLCKIIITETIIISLGCIPLGIGLGLTTTWLIVKKFGPLISKISYINTEFVFSFDFKYALIVAAIILLIGLASSIIPIKSLKKRKTIELIKSGINTNERKKIKSNRGRKDYIHLLTYRYRKTSGLRNVASNISITFSIVMMIISVSICDASIKEVEYSQGKIPYDISITKHIENKDDFEKWYQSNIVSLEYVDRCCFCIEAINSDIDIQAFASLLNEQINLYVVDDKTYNQIVDISAVGDVDYIIAGNKIEYQVKGKELIAIDKPIYDKSKIENITIGDSNKNVLCCAWDSLCAIMNCFANQEGSFILIPYSALSGINCELIAENIYINTKKHSEIAKKLKQIDNTVSINDVASGYEHEKNSFIIVRFFMCIVIMNLILISLINMYFTVVTKVILRQKDYIVLKSMGMDNRKLRKIVIGEILYQFVFVSIAGCVISIGIVLALMNTKEFSSIRFPIRITGIIMFICCLVFLFAANSASRKINKRDNYIY